MIFQRLGYGTDYMLSKMMAAFDKEDWEDR